MLVIIESGPEIYLFCHLQLPPPQNNAHTQRYLHLQVGHACIDVASRGMAVGQLWPLLHTFVGVHADSLSSISQLSWFPWTQIPELSWEKVEGEVKSSNMGRHFPKEKGDKGKLGRSKGPESDLQSGEGMSVMGRKCGALSGSTDLLNLKGKLCPRAGTVQQHGE